MNLIVLQECLLQVRSLYAFRDVVIINLYIYIYIHIYVYGLGKKYKEKSIQPSICITLNLSRVEALDRNFAQFYQEYIMHKECITKREEGSILKLVSSSLI